MKEGRTALGAASTACMACSESAGSCWPSDNEGTVSKPKGHRSLSGGISGERRPSHLLLGGRIQVVAKFHRSGRAWVV